MKAVLLAFGRYEEKREDGRLFRCLVTFAGGFRDVSSIARYL